MYALALLVLGIVAKWFLFQKAGEPGWKAIIPFYNTYIECKLADCINLFIGYIVLTVITYGVGLLMGIQTLALSFTTFHALVHNDILPFGLSYGMIFFFMIVMLAVMIGVVVIRILINLKFAKCYTDETVFKVLVGVGAVPALEILSVIGFCILGFDDKYYYRNPNNDYYM